jgi:hypothetical protein
LSRDNKSIVRGDESVELGPLLIDRQWSFGFAKEAKCLNGANPFQLIFDTFEIEVSRLLVLCSIT